MRCLKLILLCCLLTSAWASSPPEPVNLEEAVRAFHLPPSAQQQLLRDGLLVLADTCETNLWKAYDDMSRLDLPLFVTTDACLYQFYELHKATVRDVEAQFLLPLLQNLLGDWLQAVESTSLQAEEAAHARFVLSVAGRLLEDRFPVPGAIETQVAATVRNVLAAKRVEQMHAGQRWGEDYTQYLPRGHYTSSEALQRYFRAYQWLARRVYDAQEPADLRRALAMLLALQAMPGGMERYRRLVEAVETLSGEPVGIPLTMLHQACQQSGTDPQKALSDDEALARVREELAKPEYPEARIITHPVPPQSLPAPATMPRKQLRILPTAQAPDSEVLQQTGDPSIPTRMPSGLDIAAALGSRRAEELLRNTPQGAQVIEKIATFQHWWRALRIEDRQRSVYLLWLWAIQAVLEQQETAPEFMRLPAWQDWKLNTALASWAHLRHAYGLYAAPVYLYMGIKLGIPRAYLEPNPSCYERLALASEKLVQVMEAFGASPSAQAPLQEFAQLMRRYAAIAQKELREEALSEADIRAIEDFPEAIFALPRETPVTVIDIVTHSQTGQVLHVASGALHPVLVVLNARPWQPFIGVGWSLRYYELVRPASQRLTDHEWEQWLQKDVARPDPPDWARSFVWSATSEREGYNDLRRAELLLAQTPVEGVKAIRQVATRYRGTWVGAKAQLVLARHFLHSGRLTEAENALRGFFLASSLKLWKEAEQLRAIVGWQLYRHMTWQRAQPYLRCLQQAALAAANPQQREDLQALALIQTAIFFPELPFPTHNTPQRTRLLQQVIKECPHAALTPTAKYLLWQWRWIDPLSDAPLSSAAMEEGIEIIRHHPDSPVARAVLHDIVEHIGRNRQAAEQLAQAVARLTSVRKRTRADWEKAILDWVNAKTNETDSDRKSLYEKLALLRLYEGDFAGAWLASRQVGDSPAFPEYVRPLLEVWEKEGEEPARAALRVFQIEERSSHGDEFIAEAESYLARYPESRINPWLLSTLIQAYGQRGDETRKLQAQQRLLSGFPDSPQARNLHDSLSEPAHQTAQTPLQRVDLFRRLVELQRIDVEPYLAIAKQNLADALNRLIGDHPDMKDHIVSAAIRLFLDPGHFYSLRNMTLRDELHSWLQTIADSAPNNSLSATVRWALLFGERKGMDVSIHELPQVYPFAVAPPGTPHREQARQIIERRIASIDGLSSTREGTHLIDLLQHLAQRMPLYRNRLLLKGAQVAIRYRDWRKAIELLEEVARSAEAHYAAKARQMLASVQQQMARTPAFQPLWKHVLQSAELPPPRSVSQCLQALKRLQERTFIVQSANDGVRLILHTDRTTFCYRMRDGKLLWKRTDVEAPFILKSGVLIASRSQALRADASSFKRLKQEVGNDAVTLRAGELIVIPQVVAIDADTGRNLWQRDHAQFLVEPRGEVLLSRGVLPDEPPDTKKPVPYDIVDVRSGKTKGTVKLRSEEVIRLQPHPGDERDTARWLGYLMPTAREAWRGMDGYVVFLCDDGTLIGGREVFSAP